MRQNVISLIPTHRCAALAVSTFVGILFLQTSLFAQPVPTHPRVATRAQPDRPAINRPAAPRGQVITFASQPSKVGDTIQQEVEHRMEMKTTIFKNKVKVKEQATKLTRKQRRRVTALKVQRGSVIGARVTFDLADEIVQEGNQPSKTKALPIVKKTYSVVRNGEQLLITDSEGNIPPMEEFNAVLQSMESIGKPNPLAQFLAGKRIAVGQTITMPKELAKAFLGSVNEAGDITRFEMTLTGLQNVAKQKAAVFRVSVEAKSQGRMQMGLQLSGSVAISPATSRTLAIQLEGPIGIAETHATGGENIMLQGQGKIGIAMTAQTIRAR